VPQRHFCVTLSISFERDHRLLNRSEEEIMVRSRILGIVSKDSDLTIFQHEKARSLRRAS
jgi:hypothetical protein